MHLNSLACLAGTARSALTLCGLQVSASAVTAAERAAEVLSHKGLAQLKNAKLESAVSLIMD